MDLPTQGNRASRITTIPLTRYLTRQDEVSSVGWQSEVFIDIKQRLSKESGFPCVFSKNAFKNGLILFYFVEDSSRYSMIKLAEALREFVELSRQWDGTLQTSYPLIVAFSHKAIQAESVEEYHQFGWQVLQEIHELDMEDWPEDINTKPEAPGWSMCFHGMPIFCNMSNPEHYHRRSRNLGRHFVIVINPRERFDEFAGNTPAGQKMRNKIRNRISLYDDISHAPQLASYHSGGLECLQYGLPDENIECQGQCPFPFRQRNTFSNQR
ncbi:MAG TPA: YqcI/YcgG family protein [Halomonas sp.]|jgi:N-omega-hydroxy-L-arginine synthase|uniref:YqcI/YcgG family protein n=1 Tax=Vreelandella aquamarina TaxID=77097 RepID=UPI000E8AAA80|nr:YqcI/YcgG family protein [Halomonas sp.]|tara:strand:+ start:437 stop:1240 length:804 start_codon:yes stop_codon:yes gene_type:complete